MKIESDIEVAEAELGELQGKRILLVDDERDVRESMRRLLATDKHIVIEANNGAEAYSIFAQNEFDLVMTDCVMPFVCGDELALRIRQLVPQQRILMLTGHKCRRGPRNPVDLVIDKPCDYNRLREIIAKMP